MLAGCQPITLPNIRLRPWVRPDPREAGRKAKKAGRADFAVAASGPD
jgi:hypothetical protein